MKRSVFCAGLAGALMTSACGEDRVTCTTELRVAVDVRISSPEDLPIDRVTAERVNEQDCEGEAETEAPEATFACFEQGGGTYIVRVYSGDLVWTRTLEIEGDRCHVASTETLSIELTAATADED